MHYFLTTNGSKGLYSFCIPYPVTKIYGYPTSVVGGIADKLLESAKEREIKTEVVHCSLDNGIKGILFPDIKKGIINVPIYEESGLLQALDTGAPEAAAHLAQARTHFAEALLIHDAWEKYYIDNFDFGLIDSECMRLCGKILADKTANEGGIIRDRFLGAATAYGPVDYVEDITAELEKRYFIKGRPGSGKSTFLKKIIRAASERGFIVERYHCSFDPDSIDMLVIRGLNLCIFDSTAPHEHFPTRIGDEIIDFYDIAAKRNIDREFQGELTEITSSYKDKINLATDCIAHANNIYKGIEKAYAEKKDTVNLDKYIRKLESEIFA